MTTGRLPRRRMISGAPGYPFRYFRSAHHHDENAPANVYSPTRGSWPKSGRRAKFSAGTLVSYSMREPQGRVSWPCRSLAQHNHSIFTASDAAYSCTGQRERNSEIVLTATAPAVWPLIRSGISYPDRETQIIGTNRAARCGSLNGGRAATGNPVA